MKRLFKRVVSCLVVFTLIGVNVFAKEYKQRYWDVDKNHWAFGYIADLSDRNVINGYEDGSFRPEHTVTRAEWSKIMTEAAGIVSADSRLYYTDVDGHWALKYINAARGYVTSYSDGTFRPDQAITREDVTVALVRLKGYSTADVDYSYIADFKDVDSLSNFAKVFVAVAVEKGLISGYEDKTFRGQGTLTRAEAATLLYRAFQMGSDNKVTKTVEEPIKTPSITPSDDDTNKVIDSKPEASQLPEILGDSKEEGKTTKYEIRTIKKTAVNDSHRFITSDYINTIFYVDGNSVFSLDINSGDTTQLYNFDNFNSTEMFTERDFTIVSICYNSSDDLLYVAGRYDSESTTVITLDREGKVVDTKSDIGPLYSGVTLVLNDTTYLSCNYIVDAPDFQEDVDRTIGISGYNNMIILNSNGTLSGVDIQPGNACVQYTYNFSSLDKNVLGTAANAGISSYGYVYAMDKKLIIEDNGGNQQNIGESDYAVTDMLPVSFNAGKVERGLMLFKDKSVAFYDRSAEAFRIVAAK